MATSIQINNSIYLETKKIKQNNGSIDKNIIVISNGPPSSAPKIAF